MRAGWRHRFEQSWRFELACELLCDGSPLDLIDLGCGPGALLDHLLERGEQIARYVGLDLLKGSIDEARKRHEGVSEAAFFCQDFHRASHEASASVALGALIDGAPCASERERQRRLGRFVSSCVRLGRHRGVIVALEQGWLEDHGGALALEPALFGVRAGEELEALRGWMSSSLGVTTSVRAGGLSSDVALFWARGAQAPELLRRSDEQLLARVFEQDDPSCEQPFWRAWLCAQIEGMEQRALQELERALQRGTIDRCDRARAALLYERLSGEEVEQEGC